MILPGPGNKTPGRSHSGNSRNRSTPKRLLTEMGQWIWKCRGTGRPAEQASLIRRYFTWRNRHTTDPALRKVIRRAETIKRVKVA